MRRLAIGALALVLLVVGARLAVRPVIASDAFRAWLEVKLGAGLGVEVAIADPIEPAISLLPGLDLSGVRFDSPDDAAYWLAADVRELSLRIRLSSLLRGPLETRLRADGVDLRFALPPGDDASPASFDLAGLLERLPHLRVANARVRPGQDGEPGGLELRVAAASLAGCGAFDFAGALNELPVSLETRLACEGPRELRLGDLSAEVAGLPVEGELAISFGRPGTRVEGSLRSARLDLRDRGDAEASQAEDADAWLDRGLPYDRLAAVDLDLSLAAKAVALPRASLENAWLAAKLEGGKLALEARAGLDGGSLVATLRAQAGGTAGALGVTAALSNLPLRHWYDAEGVTGSYSIDLGLAGAGQTLRQVLASSDGSLHVTLDQAQFAEPLLGPLGKDIARVLTSQFQSDQPTRFECAALHSEFSAGIGSPSVLVADTPDLTLAGGGVIDLRRLYLDLRLRPRPKSPAIIALKTPLRIAGPFDDLSAGLDTAELAMDTGRLLTEGLLDPRRVASIFVDLGGHGSGVCEVDLAQATRAKSDSLLRTTTRTARGLGGWVLGVFRDAPKNP